MTISKKGQRESNNLTVVRYLKRKGYTNLPGFERWVECLCHDMGLAKPQWNADSNIARKEKRDFIANAASIIKRKHKQTTPNRDKAISEWSAKKAYEMRVKAFWRNHGW